MRLQIALDTFDLDAALEVLACVRPHVDIAEIGTGLGISAGVRAIAAVKSAAPEISVLSDIKIMDGGSSMASHVLDAGADLVSVLGVADDATVAAAVGAAHERGKHVVADLIGVRDIAERAAELDLLGVDVLCVHTPYDLRESVLPPTEALSIVRSVATRAESAVTGGITLDAIDRIVSYGPDVVVVGGALMNAPDPAATAARFARAVRRG
ncbi:3-hexulose-6-phosphate synthase [Salana multivorans]|uniref:3-hexulose-6-phosphate synthase n=1 Tax=Salana multivorans TaxID=120377 RepID=A0A3N2D956_9MICO|nr:3-hexulose-6-phosphate synthase [Salana multivorans]MBN8882215.1 orotidine 5'-phosphate decarboxylase [Salana multivorans]OJX97332.1 MAG: hypothetical protein BGO96_05180 [Micrococcales bacterium 73-15]ROR96326.1 3-hexulose-6-phosphate synthase [Salana multivorans]